MRPGLGSCGHGTGGRARTRPVTDGTESLDAIGQIGRVSPGLATPPTVRDGGSP